MIIFPAKVAELSAFNVKAVSKVPMVLVLKTKLLVLFAPLVSVTIADDSDELLVMQAVAQLINKHPHSDGIIVVADDVNSVYAHSAMTAVGAAG